VARQLGFATLAPVRFTILIESTADCLVISAAGPATLAELSGLVAMAKELVAFHGHARLLADLAGVQPHLSFTDHLRLGALLRDLLGSIERLAAVVPPGYLDAPAAKAAKLAGVPLKTFLELDEARAWLAPPALQARFA
jgi:hypothetical protein